MSGNVMIDLRSGAAPSGLVIRLLPATRVMLVVKGAPADGTHFRVTDAQGRELVRSRFYGDAPRGLTVPPGSYKFVLVGTNDSVLSEKNVTVGAVPMTVELAR